MQVEQGEGSSDVLRRREGWGLVHKSGGSWSWPGAWTVHPSTRERLGGRAVWGWEPVEVLFNSPAFFSGYSKAISGEEEEGGAGG